MFYVATAAFLGKSHLIGGPRDFGIAEDDYERLIKKRSAAIAAV